MRDIHPVKMELNPAFPFKKITTEVKISLFETVLACVARLTEGGQVCSESRARERSEGKLRS